MKKEGWLSLRVLWLAVLLIATSSILMLAGWVFAEWRVQHVEKEMREEFLHQTRELASIVNPALVAELSFTSEDKTRPAYQRITEQFKAYIQDLPVKTAFGLAFKSGDVVYGPVVFGKSQTNVTTGDAYSNASDDLEEMIKVGKCFFQPSPEHNTVTALAPVFDPKSDDILMMVALEMPYEVWQQQLTDIRYFPVVIALLLLLLLALCVGAIYLRYTLIPKRLRHLETVFVAVFCLLITGIIVFFVYEAENRTRRIHFMEIARFETELIESNLRSIQREIFRVAHFQEQSKKMTKKLFLTSVRPLLEDQAIESCFMITALQPSEKESLEERARQEGLTDYSLYQLDESGNKTALDEPTRTLYPIYYEARTTPAAIGPGFDFGSISEERVALETAARTGMATGITPGREAIAEASGKRITVHVPVYDTGDSETLLLRGFVSAVIRFDILLQQALASIAEDASMISLEMFQLLANETPLAIADVDAKLSGDANVLFDFLQNIGDKAFALNHSLFVFSNTYVFIVNPSPEFFNANPFFYMYVVGGIALVLTIMITIFVGIYRNQQGLLEARIWESTIELRESGETFRRLFAESTDPILLLKQGRIVDCNNATLRLLKYGAKQQLIKRRPEDLSPPKQPDGQPSPYLFKEMVGLCVRNGHHAFEWTHLKSDGTPVPVETMLTLITIRGEKHIHVIWRDITERKQAEEALRGSEEKYRSLVDSIPIGLYRFTPAPEERFVMVNKAMVKIYGADSAEDMMQIPARALYANPEDREALWQELEENGSIEGYEVQLKRKDDTIIWGSISGTILRTPAGVIEYFDGSVMDITERKRAAEERMEMERKLLHTQKLESLGMLAGGIAHDFNNLLAVVLGNLEYASGELYGETAAGECIAKASMAARRAAALTDQMLAYSGKGRFIIKAMDLSVEIEENVQILRSAISKDVTLDLSLQESLPPIYADAGQIQQVVMNLIANASEAIGDNPGAIAIKTEVITCTAEELQRSLLEEKPEPGEFIVLEIKDTGCGMDEDTQRRAFDPFFTTKFTGRGLGMSAVLGIVQGHKGALELVSTVGEGTTIRLLFPVAEPPEDLPVAETVETEEEKPAERPKMDTWSGTFLVVDDEAPLRELGEKVLARFGFDTITACDGQEAVDIFKEHSDDIVAVLLDLTMPRLDGVAAFNAMRQIKPDVKVILCSGFSEHEAMQRFSDQGLAGYVHKPYRITVLREEIEKVMKGEGNL